MTVPHIRRGGGGNAVEQVYQLGGDESFRLDACSFTIDFANEGSYVIPTLIAKDSGGFTIAEIAAPGLLISPPGLGPIDYTGPAVMTDDVSLFPPDGYGGYLFHDFGAGVTTSQLTITWTQPPGLQEDSDEVWLRSAGAASMGPVIGTATVEGAASVTVTLTAGIAAGHYLLLHTTVVSPTNWINPTGAFRPTVTDSVGGNFMDFPNAATGCFSQTSLQRPDGQYLSSFSEFYRIVNPLSIGDTVTLTYAFGAPQWMQLNVNDVTGLTVGNPRGPNAGGNYTLIGQSPGVSPFTTTANPVPNWVGPVLIIDGYLIGTGGVANVQLARGGVENIEPGATPLQGTTHYVQAALPELHLGPKDTLTVSSFDTLGVRVQDTVSDLLVWGVDE